MAVAAGAAVTLASTAAGPHPCHSLYWLIGIVDAPTPSNTTGSVIGCARLELTPAKYAVARVDI